MSSLGSSTTRREGDGWTMVDRCVSELMENDSIGDMTLPPLPPFDGGGPGEDYHTSSSTSSSLDSEDEDDDDDDYAYDDQGWSGDEEEPLAYGEEQVPRLPPQQHRDDTKPLLVPATAWPDTDDGDDVAATAATLAGFGATPAAAAAAAPATSGVSGARRRPVAASATSRRPAGRRRERAAGLAVGASSPSVSPTRPPRRRGGGGGGRTERSGRRMDEGPPPLQSASEASDDDDASSEFPSSSSSSGGQEEGRRERARSSTGARGPVALPVGGGAESGGSRGGGGGGGGSGLVPFSLSELACVASETVSDVTGGSAANSPFRIQSSGGGGGGGGDGDLPPGFATAAAAAAAGGGVMPSGSSSTVPAAGAAAQADPAARRTSAPALLEEDADGRLQATPRLSALAAARYGRCRGGGRGRASEEGATPSVSRVVSALELPLGRSSGSSSNDNRSKGYDDAASESTPAGINSSGSADGSKSDNTPLSAATGEETTTSPSSSFLSARGLTPSSLVPLGPLLDWEGGSKGGGGGRGRGASMNMSASLAGFAGYKSALLEARRAAAAEEQGEFWQRRASSAEKAKDQLQKVVAQQKAQIAELLERCASLEDEKAAPSAAASPAHGDRTTPSPAIVGEQDNATAGGGAASRTVAAPHSAVRGQRRGSGRGRIGTAEEMGGGRAASSVVVASGAAAGEEEEKGEGGGVGEALACIGGIAFTRFSVGQVAMFFPTPEGNFLAFNVGCPRHFLSKESQDLVGRDEHFRSYYVLGRIIEIRGQTCEEENPYSLPVGQSIKVMSVESITPDLHRAGVVPCKWYGVLALLRGQVDRTLSLLGARC
ncbi:unnamed protein product [Ectocarpus sp. 13 AM-2016]